METVLNLVWLCVSVALLLVGAFHVMRGGQDRSRGMAAIAMVCLICLLFPVISMTDDLNSGILALPESNKFKRFLSVAQLVMFALPALALQITADTGWVAALEHNTVSFSADELFPFNLSRRPPPHFLFF